MDITEEERKKLCPKDREPTDWTDEDIEKVSILAGRGLRHIDIAHYFGISKRQFYYDCKTYPKLRDAVMKGKSRMISFVGGKLIDKIKEGNVQSTIFYLRTQAGFKYTDIDSETETKQVEGDSISESERIELNTSDPNEAAKRYQEIMLGNE